MRKNASLGPNVTSLFFSFLLIFSNFPYNLKGC